MQRDELGHWLRLTLSPGIGNSTARKLLTAFGLPESIFEQSHAALCQVVSAAQATALQSPPENWDDLLTRACTWVQQGIKTDTAQHQIWTLGHPAYPAGLLQMEDPPLMLYAMGTFCETTATLAALQERSIAIVGSRNPTPQGETNARQFAKALTQAGITVVSGLALGVDGAAHEGALEGAQPQALATIAVVGTGLDRVYPKKHLDLAHRIAQRGCLLSEYPLGTPALAANFPKRNRLIAGLSRGVLVVEAALQSGSLITARLGAEQGKEVFAIPGSIHSPQSRGCHALLKQGAKLVESAQDVLEEFAWAPSAARMPEDAMTQPPDNALLAHLGFDPVSLDALIARTGMDVASLQVQLLTLELDGQVARLPGGLFQRINRG